ncbi:ATP-dependent RNA helicase [Leifsonia xyli subsp. cynodontis DSM 46306]|uniref:RNA helicase n=1 Tax=Leifsonia xyli subsp. cynodontis DSM 46306 TaxID=1389489 RepID=U3P7U3_LEIXC|nr:DEAD/DEAH box helicase [Leifsonia xyli]AGW41534.1 ATP-dependent RNA helicase [Leifsonia xyli subsp. cynodontis DSM 46306]
MTDQQQLSLAERFAASRQRTRQPLLETFLAGLRFDLDPFQREACTSLENGRSVLVAAPTGAGKTIVAEFAVFLAMREANAKVFYTTPMKALSNQKFQELQDTYGPESVGLLTGDTNINSHARIVVMTTEVLRNMLYADSDLLGDLAYVVMDEVHYLADRFRGAVWEEVIIHLPPPVRMVSLSATVSNAEEFGDWLQAVRGDTDVVVSEERPVPLEQHILMRSKLIDLFDSSGLAATNRVNPELVQMARSGGRVLSSRQTRDVGRRHSRGGRPDSFRMNRAEIVRLLDEHNLLPAIFFLFSRNGCDAAVQQTLRAGVRLTEQRERDEIRSIVEERCRTLLDEDLAVLGYWEWLEGLERGVAAHHAGMLPAFKEVVEELFRRKLVKVVFATETLALGINMPARTIVLEKLEKFNGESRVPITPGEYTQLTGRAGRRGIDVEGHSVIQWEDGLDPQSVASLASRRSYPLNSSFRPTYNMAVNLIDQFGRQRTREILESSFAQFQADRAVVDLARKVRQQEESLAGYERAMTCHLGDFREYSRLRRELTDLERKGQRLDNASRADRDRRQRQLTELRKRMREHPCHRCPDREQHARWAERWWKLKRETDRLSAQIQSRTGAVAKVFDRVSDVLDELGYLVVDDGATQLTAHGRTLKRIYGERDLLVAECLRRGTWKELDAPSLAAMACALVFEPRRDDGLGHDRALPQGAFRPALDKTTDLWSRLDDLERENRLPGSEPPSTALALAMHQWARGSGLDAVLREADMAAGDFVRWTKQTIDLLDQLSLVAQGKVGRTARQALDAIRRGIVAYSSVA